MAGSVTFAAKPFVFGHLTGITPCLRIDLPVSRSETALLPCGIHAEFRAHREVGFPPECRSGPEPAPAAGVEDTGLLEPVRCADERRWPSMLNPLVICEVVAS